MRRKTAVENNGLKLPIKPEFMILFERRSNAIQSLLESLAELPREEQFRILCGWMSLDNLESCAEFNELKSFGKKSKPTEVQPPKEGIE